MTKDTTITARDGESRAKPVSAGMSASTAGTSKPGVSKPASSKQAVSKPIAAKPKTAKPKTTKPKTGKSKAVAKSKAAAKTSSRAPTKAPVKKAANAAAKAVSKAKVPAKSVKTARPKPVSQSKAAAPALATPSFGLSFQATVPAAVAMNTKLVDIAHSNVSAGLELARDLAGAKSPMEAMRLGVAYWFNHMGAVQAQARELQSLSAAWVKTASG